MRSKRACLFAQDASLTKCGKFYPEAAKESIRQLEYYSRQQPGVEVDTSSYAIPKLVNIRCALLCVRAVTRRAKT